LKHQKYELDLKLCWTNKNPAKPSIDKEKIYKPYQVTLIENLFSKDFENFDYSYQSWVESDSLMIKGPNYQKFKKGAKLRYF
jgi:hypothetical protein